MVIFHLNQNYLRTFREDVYCNVLQIIYYFNFAKIFTCLFLEDLHISTLEIDFKLLIGTYIN